MVWLDPLRAFLGTVLLQRAVGVADATWTATAIPEYVLPVGLIGVGVVGQSITRRGDTGLLLAPVGFVAGIVAALTPSPVAVLGIVTATLGLFAFRQFRAFVAFGLVAVCLLGIVPGTGMMWIGPAVGVLSLPIVANLVTGSTLEVPARNASGRPPVPHSKTCTNISNTSSTRALFARTFLRPWRVAAPARNSPRLAG